MDKSTDLVTLDATSTAVETTRRDRRSTKPPRRVGLWVLVAVLVLAVGSGVFLLGNAFGWLEPTGELSSGSVDEPVGGTRPVDASAPAPVIGAFSVTPEAAECTEDRGGATAPLSFSWDSTDADRAWIGVGTSDASISPTAEVPLSSDGWTEIEFECFSAEQNYTLTVQGPGGTTSSMITVRSTEL